MRPGSPGCQAPWLAQQIVRPLPYPSDQLVQWLGSQELQRDRLASLGQRPHRGGTAYSGCEVQHTLVQHALEIPITRVEFTIERKSGALPNLNVPVVAPDS